MSFDKIKAMRSAERFLSQGKIRSAINEYKRIVEENPKDFSTLNILGDLHTKCDEINEAVVCFRFVAEHYNGQGFANKAIAIYNKIHRLQPDSMEVTAKLAQLYQMRGSYAEARDHYTRLAENYQSRGQKIEALAIWKQIAELDPNNTRVYLTIAESCLQENENDEACKAFTEAGLRFNGQNDFESAVAAFSKSLTIQPENLKTLNGFVVAKIGLGCADEAADALEKILETHPYNRDVLYLLVECYLDMDDVYRAEQTVLKLVQQEPANYPKFLELVEGYLKTHDLESAVRVLNISSDSLLGGGQAEEFLGLTTEVLKRNPEQLEALQLLVRYHTWQGENEEVKAVLERLAESARLNEDFEKEKQALVQLVRMNPQNPVYTERLQELKDIYGFEDVIIEPQIEQTEVPEFENFIGLNEDSKEEIEAGRTAEGFEQYNGDFSYSEDTADEFSDLSEEEAGHQTRDFAFADASFENFQTAEEVAEPWAESAEDMTPRPGDEIKFQNEIESIEFYLAQGYTDLAQKCLDSLDEEFGDRPETEDLRNRLSGIEPAPDRTEPDIPTPTAEVEESDPDETSFADLQETPTVAPEEEPTPISPEPADEVSVFEQFRNDLGLEEVEESNENDYSTHYQMAIAYKEMGLMEEAIKEFQMAANLVLRNDGTRRYFQCANLLGHCFMMKGMPNLALTWFKRALETENLNDDEIQALNYEVASSYEASGENEKAFAYFEQIYALDVDYRDIGRRMENLKESQAVL